MLRIDAPVTLMAWLLLLGCGASGSKAPAPRAAPQPPPAAASSAAPEAAPPDPVDVSAEGIAKDKAFAAMLAPCGVYVVGKYRKTTGRAFLSSRNVKMLDPNNPTLFVIDDLLVQVAVTVAPEIAGDGLRGKALLDHHRNWEVKWASERQGWKEPETRVFMSQPSRAGSSIEAQVWGYKAPVSLTVMGSEVSSVSFASAAVGEVILTVSALIRAPEDPDRALSVSQSFLRTVTAEQPGFDIQAFAKSVGAQAAADPRCEHPPPQP